MADFMWYAYSFEGRMVVVLCGVLINPYPANVENMVSS